MILDEQRSDGSRESTIRCHEGQSEVSGGRSDDGVAEAREDPAGNETGGTVRDSERRRDEPNERRAKQSVRDTDRRQPYSMRMHEKLARAKGAHKTAHLP